MKNEWRHEQCFFLVEGLVKSLAIISLSNLCELSASVSHESDDALFVDALVCCPRSHHSRVVDAKHDHFIDPFLRKFHLVLLVPWNLARGSGWSEGARKAHKDNLKSNEVVDESFRLGWRLLNIECSHDCVPSCLRGEPSETRPQASRTRGQG